MSSADFTLVILRPRMWHKLRNMALRARDPRHKHLKGGWQDRLKRWHDHMDEKLYSVLLLHQSVGREIDDMTFIERALYQKHGGGWQKHAWDIFAGTHPRFTGIVPKPRRSQR